ncbi:MAG: phosphopyruvate hydratase [Acidobacteria bacterium]|nr:phosphopyruvate hydratase [Acidobacteriota bacterium]
MPKIEKLSGREILDSRGRPTVSATCVLEGGVMATASVPSGASTGTAEAFELRDGEAERYQGLGCRKAAANLGGELHHALAGRAFHDQAELDQAMIALDGTPNKSRLGANAILAASVAFARASALQRKLPLYAHFADLLGSPAGALPRLTINLFSGGKHAGQQVSIQDVLIIPMSAPTVDEALVAASNVYQAAAELVFSKYGMRLLTADEGGLAPPFRTVEEMFALAVEAIERAGYAPGIDVALGVDVASSHFYHNHHYKLDSQLLDSQGMIQTIAGWLERFPILSVEDGLAEDDWEHWPALRQAIAGRALTLGDDFLCTNPARISRAVAANACDALLLKVNQIGTLSEALAAYRQARAAGWAITLSVRSGETEDNWAADLAVGWQADQFKNGSIRQSERLAKYNRLLEIAETTGWVFTPWPQPRKA